MLEGYVDAESSEDEDFLEFAILVAFPRRAKTFFPRRNYFIELGDDQFFERFRLSKIVVMHVLNKFRHEISSPTNRYEYFCMKLIRLSL
jgi:hypothetical protein